MKAISSFLTNLPRKQKVFALVLSDCLIAFLCWIVFGPPFSILIASNFQSTLFNLIYSNYVSFVIPFLFSHIPASTIKTATTIIAIIINVKFIVLFFIWEYFI